MKECYGCTERTIWCHSYCPDYAKRREKNIERSRAKQADKIGMRYAVDSIHKAERRTGKVLIPHK